MPLDMIARLTDMSSERESKRRSINIRKGNEQQRKEILEILNIDRNIGEERGSNIEFNTVGHDPVVFEG